MTDIVLFISIALVLVFSFSNGMKDGSNVTATAVASRSFSRRNAMIIVLCAEFLLRNASFRATKYIMKGQIASLVFLGLNHGSNDSQKAMGVIALLLFLAGKTSQVQITSWIKIASISALVLGITMGGVKIIKTVGYDIFQLRPIHSLSSHISASVVLLFSNLIGAPVSTTQVITSSVMGVGSAFRARSVRWSLIFIIIWSWILTIPLSALVSIVIYITITFIIGKTG